jgi:hypothetical protein
LLTAQEQGGFVPEKIPGDTVFYVPADTIPQESSLLEKKRRSAKHEINNRDTTKSKTVLSLVDPEKKFSPSSTKAVIYSAIFPGLGQIYNRKYWKLPIVYGGLMGCAYAISFNSRYYNDYSSAYLDFVDDDPNTNSYLNFLPYGSQVATSNSDWFMGVLKRKKDFYRRNRDLSYIVTIGLYVICMIDAYVDAELFNFDISRDLTFRVEPTFFERTNYNQISFGLQCNFRF